MGMTQQVSGVENVQMLINLLLLRGNIGKPGAGILPIRGHSNVQGQRTVGITEKPELVPIDKLRDLYGFEPPQEKGLNCTEACEALIKGELKAMFQLGGNLVRSLPDHEPTGPGVAQFASDRADRNQAQPIVPGPRRNFLHFALPRPYRNRSAERAAPQAVSVEDSTACIHGSRGYARRRQVTDAALRAVDRRRDGKGDVAAQPQDRLGRLGRRLQFRSETRSSGPIRRCFSDFN